MAAASDLVVNGGAGTLHAEEEPDEPPEHKNAPVPWPAAVAERYERREKLGQGIFSDVYKAWDRVGKRYVAVKRLAGRTGGGFVQAGIRDLAREAMSLAACRDHPRIVQLVATHADSGRSDGDCFVVTEYAGPMNLRHYMDVRRRNGDPFDEDEVREIIRQLLAALEHAHGTGLLHRDVVPDNVVVDIDQEEGEGSWMAYKLCGFGMSEPAAARAGKQKQDDFGMATSPSAYRAPELFLGSKDYDGRIDTWALGCIMAELVAGTGGVPYFRGKLDREGKVDTDAVLNGMLYAVGMKGIAEWQGLERVAPSDRVASIRKTGRRKRGHLREFFPREALSRAGFEVLKGLLHSNPDRRLTAADALSMPWFRLERHPRCFGGCLMPRCKEEEA